MKWSKYRSRVLCTLVKLEIIPFKIGSLNLRFRHNNVTNISLPDGKTCSKNLNGVITTNCFCSKATVRTIDITYGITLPDYPRAILGWER